MKKRIKISSVILAVFMQTVFALQAITNFYWYRTIIFKRVNHFSGFFITVTTVLVTGGYLNTHFIIQKISL